jgi:anti-sigma factor RsiW
MNCAEIQELVHGYLDDELAFTQALPIDDHLASCEACRQVYAQARALRSAVREQAPYYPAPDLLRSRILKAVRASALQPASRTLTVSGWSVGAALACTVLLTWGLTVYLMRPAETAHLPDDLISSHIRSLLASNAADVLSSDQHTVKPWFNGKLDFSPPVQDLTAQGFALIGGRLDYIAGRPVAVLVYRHRQHLINLFIWPTADGGNSAVQTLTKQGYHLVHWTHAGMAFWAVSDLNQEELVELAHRLNGR